MSLKIPSLTISGKTLNSDKLKPILKKGILGREFKAKIWGLFREQGDFIPMSDIYKHSVPWVSRGIREGWLITNKNPPDFYSVFRTFVD